MIPDGNEFVIDRVAADYWRSLFALALGLVLFFRVARPLVQSARFDLRVTEVIEEAPGVVSLRIGGRGLERLGAEAGQFFFWRFLTGGFWSTKHPFSLSEAPNGDSFRITVKSLGDHTARLGEIPVGTRVFAEGPFGVFTRREPDEPKALLIAGGIGITPVRALLESMDGDVVALYRVASSADIVFGEELDRIAAGRGSRVEYVVGDHTERRGARAAHAEPPRGTRPGYLGPRRLRLRPSGDGRPNRAGPAPRRTSRAVTFTSSASPCRARLGARPPCPEHERPSPAPSSERQTSTRRRSSGFSSSTDFDHSCQPPAPLHLRVRAHGKSPRAARRS